MSMSLGTFAFRNLCHRLAILLLLLAPLMVQALPIEENATPKEQAKTGASVGLDMIEVVLVVVAASLALVGLFASAYFSCQSAFLS
jgi:hypothetical protein